MWSHPAQWLHGCLHVTLPQSHFGPPSLRSQRAHGPPAWVQHPRPERGPSHFRSSWGFCTSVRAAAPHPAAQARTRPPSLVSPPPHTWPPAARPRGTGQHFTPPRLRCGHPRSSLRHLLPGLSQQIPTWSPRFRVTPLELTPRPPGAQNLASSSRAGAAELLPGPELPVSLKPPPALCHRITLFLYSTCHSEVPPLPSPA